MGKLSGALRSKVQAQQEQTRRKLTEIKDDENALIKYCRDNITKKPPRDMHLGDWYSRQAITPEDEDELLTLAKSELRLHLGIKAACARHRAAGFKLPERLQEYFADIAVGFEEPPRKSSASKHYWRNIDICRRIQEIERYTDRKPQASAGREEKSAIWIVSQALNLSYSTIEGIWKDRRMYGCG